MKCLNEEAQKMQLKAEKKQSELHRVQSDKNAIESVLKTREQMLESLQRQVTQLKEDLRAKEIQADAAQKRHLDEDRDKEFQLREERAKAHKESDRLEKQVRELQV